MLFRSLLFTSLCVCDILTNKSELCLKDNDELLIPSIIYLMKNLNTLMSKILNDSYNSVSHRSTYYSKNINLGVMHK